MARDVARPAVGQVLAEAIQAGCELADRDVYGLTSKDRHATLEFLDDGGWRQWPGYGSAAIETVEYLDHLTEQFPLELDRRLEIGEPGGELGPLPRCPVEEGRVWESHVRSV
jgi:hypothetical protein